MCVYMHSAPHYHAEAVPTLSAADCIRPLAMTLQMLTFPSQRNGKLNCSCWAIHRETGGQDATHSLPLIKSCSAPLPGTNNMRLRPAHKTPRGHGGPGTS